MYEVVPDFGSIYGAVPLYAARTDVLIHLLARSGFRVDTIYGDFDRSPLTDKSPEEVVCATRQ